MRYVLDTNIVSEPVVARPDPSVLQKIKANSGALAIASVTWQELLYGLFLLPTGKRRDQIDEYLFRRVRPTLPILGFDERAAQLGTRKGQRAQIHIAPLIEVSKMIPFVTPVPAASQ